MAKKDLTPVLNLIEHTLKQFFETDEKVGLAIAFTLPPEYENASWITNLSRSDGILLFEKTAENMKLKRNNN